MRWVVLGIMMLPLSQALVLEDPIGDQELRVNGQVLPVQISGEPQADIVSFSIEEGVDRLIFTRIAAGPPEHPVARQWFTIDFDAGGHHYTILGTPSASRLQVFQDGNTHFEDPQIGRSMTAHAQAHTLRFELPKQLFPGADALQAIQTRTWVADSTFRAASVDTAGTVEIIDVVPNQGSANMDLLLKPSFHGPVATVAPQVYDSNGESGVYSFKVHGSGLDAAAVSIEGPDGFRWASPGRIDTSNATTFEFLIAAPGAHQHGTEAVFWLVLEDDGAASRIPFGIRYASIPLLTGHHDTIYLRAMQPRQSDDWVGGFMTTQASPTPAAIEANTLGGHLWTTEPLSSIRTSMPAGASAHVELHLEPPPGIDEIEVSITPPGGGYFDAARGRIPVTSGQSIFKQVLPFPAAAFPGGEPGQWSIQLLPYSFDRAGTAGPLHDISTNTNIRLELEDVPAMLQDDPARETTNITAPAAGHAFFDWPSTPLYGLAYCADVDVVGGRLQIGNVVGACEGGLVTSDGVERLWIVSGPTAATGKAAVSPNGDDPGKSSPAPLVVVVVAIALALLRRR